jgi:hypothetical protein
MGLARSTYGWRRVTYRILVEKHRERDNLEVPYRRREDNIKFYGRVGMDQIHLAQDRDRWPAPAKAVINYHIR